MKRFIGLLVCAIVFVVTPTFADYDKASDAWSNGDYVTALRELRPLVEQGNAKAQYFLGVMYANGQGVSKDYSEAAKLYILSAEQGYSPAQYNLGLLYGNGYGVLQDYLEAVKWLKLAAEDKLQWAHSDLGVMYYNGTGVPKDYVRAYMWANLGASEGNEKGIKLRDEVAKKMTPEQILEAQKLSRECLAKDYKGC